MTDIKRIGMISILYIISFGLMLFNKGIYWDDWVWYKLETPFLYDAMSQLGAPWLAYYFHCIFSFDNILIFRFITFFAYWGAMLFLYFVLKTIDKIDEDNRIYICIFFAIFPCNSSRSMICLSPYAISYFLFFLGFFLVSLYIKKRNIGLRIVSLCIFFVSFITNSFLVFYLLILLYIGYIEKITKYNIIVTIKRYCDFVVLPLIFWIIKKYFFIPHGAYSGYNGLNTEKILLSPFTSISVFCKAYILTIINSFSEYIPPIIILIGAFITYTILSKMLKGEPFFTKNKEMIVWGGFIFFISAFPYLAVGAFPGNDFAQSRHQLLLPLSLSIILVYSTSFFLSRLRIVNKIKMRTIIFSLLIAIFTSYNGIVCYNFQKDWYKQVSLISNIKNNTTIASNTTFLFKDKTVDLNVRSREYSYYELNGMMKQAFGDEKRLGYCMDERSGRVDKPAKPIWLVADYQAAKEITIIIKEGELKLSATNMLQLLYNEYFHHDKFNKDINTIISLTVESSSI